MVILEAELIVLVKNVSTRNSHEDYLKLVAQFKVLKGLPPLINLPWRLLLPPHQLLSKSILCPDKLLVRTFPRSRMLLQAPTNSTCNDVVYICVDSGPAPG